jgi:hypothetical protein|uniref:Uncharacterized protein n=1 Tax=viral metagenome TaxID=1070528 RepID=A0A6C0AH94_9ZZZZ
MELEYENDLILLGRNLCVPAHVEDDRILRAWGSLIGNNAVQRIELRDTKKIIHLDPDYIERLADDEDEMAEILEMYQELETEGTILFCFHTSTESWTYGDQGIYPANLENTRVQFEVCFE